jgi:branched-subunit amino acid ABC-type transport system permease component
MAQRAYDEDQEECRSAGVIFWMALCVIYALGLGMACLAGALLAGWRG